MPLATPFDSVEVVAALALVVADEEVEVIEEVSTVELPEELAEDELVVAVAALWADAPEAAAHQAVTWLWTV